jgi:hypothetical protein
MTRDEKRAELFAAIRAGLAFRPMTEDECGRFENAPDGSYIAYSDVAVYVMCKNTLWTYVDGDESVFLI